MISVHGLVRVTHVDPLKDVKDFFILNMKIQSFERKRVADGNWLDRFDNYEAFMFFTSQQVADLWVPQMIVGRVLDIRWATLQGSVTMADGNERGRTQVRLYPNISHTIPKK